MLDHQQTPADAPEQIVGLMRFFYYLLAMIFFVFGIMGIWLPLVPATPFFLLMSYFLVRVSPSMNQRVMKIPMVGKLLSDWNEKRGVRKNVKMLAYLMVFVFVGGTITFSDFGVLPKVAVAVLGFIGAFVVFRLNTVES